jgi:quercetin dioxygenase-like cupin family protein
MNAVADRFLDHRVVQIERAEYSEALSGLQHVFLVGNLQRPTPHPFLKDERVEVVLCYYHSGDDGLYHWHREVTEYEFMIEGEIGYFEVSTGQVRWFHSGDFVMIPAGVCVKRLVRRSAYALAVKIPSADEKVQCSECCRQCKWRMIPQKEK